MADTLNGYCNTTTATSNDVAVDEKVVASATAALDAEYEALCLDATVLV